MTTEIKNLPPIARFVNERLEELKGELSQREVAEIVGYEHQNMITMIKQGKAKVAIERVTKLAEALRVDPAPFMRMALEQFYDPKLVDVIGELLALRRPETGLPLQ